MKQIIIRKKLNIRNLESVETNILVTESDAFTYKTCLDHWPAYGLYMSFLTLKIAIYTETRALLIMNFISPLKPKRRPLYLKPQSVPRCKHFSSGL